MKIVIDIPDGYVADSHFLNNIQNGSIACGQILKAVKNGKPYEERPQGKWEKPFLHSDGKWYHKCTNCHICSEVSILQVKYCNFCVNCGADMRGGRE